ncbi:PEPxxWA-CTERM sorting domain-containing protein [Sandarakinorhabdus sp.]|uniref:PEPxxWA-CTERM sorting domain-containing protein n=1 Tax=Sandarakinorhabdus sp. TaxID=1916663 RepID=UPI00286DC15D|nr:PEPxxWA-CTERM sorting domain-containing protein [Sandarakinorhabdus sp.]
MMMDIDRPGLMVVGRSLASRLLALALASTVFVAATSPAAAVTQSWNGYRWARTGPLAINIGNNLDSKWSGRLVPTANAWSAANNIDFVPAAGRATSSACGPVYGSVQVCNANYGANGWLGYANVWLSNGFIVQATVKLNDYYFGIAKYNTDAWRQMTICQEIGHTLGLAHTNTIKTNLNTGSCMDYTNDPTGTAGGANGTLANVAPNAVDFAALGSIYANLDQTQLSYTRPTHMAGEGFSVDGRDHDMFVGVPEPDSWAMMIAGFGIIGAVLRSRRRQMVTL